MEEIFQHRKIGTQLTMLVKMILGALLSRLREYSMYEKSAT